MTPTITGLVGIGILLIILFSRMPIGFGMGLVGFLGFAYLVGFGPALGLLKTVPYSTFSSHSLSVIPLFILMGSFAFSAGLSRDLYQAAYKWLGHLRVCLLCCHQRFQHGHCGYHGDSSPAGDEKI